MIQVVSSSLGQPQLEVTGNLYHQIQTHLMIDAAGQAKAGQTTLYLVEAQVTNDATGMQVAGTDLQIQGTPLTDMTHGDGSVWSDALVSAPAGVNADVTPTATAPNTGSDKSLNVLGQECKLKIMANGAALDPDKPVSDASFCVGQNVAFSVTNLRPAQGRPISNGPLRAIILTTSPTLSRVRYSRTVQLCLLWIPPCSTKA